MNRHEIMSFFVFHIVITLWSVVFLLVAEEHGMLGLHVLVLVTYVEVSHQDYHYLSPPTEYL